MTGPVRGRFAPSPSGRMHLGNAWTALLAWLSARSQDGAVILRLEDLDPDRSKEPFARALLDDLAWLGLTWDEGPDIGGPHGPYRQSQRRDFHQRCLERLCALGLTYPCFCTRAELRGVNHALAPHAGETEPAYPGACRELDEAGRLAALASGRKPALRLRVGDAAVAFDDLALGPQEQVLARLCGDFVLRRADGVHAYQLAVAVDDADQGVTEVVRGADLLDSTGRQLHILRLLNLPEPRYGHVPLLVDPSGRRLSKRNRDVDLGSLRDRGVAPAAVIGYLAYRAGLLTRPRSAAPGELLAGFSFSALPKGPVVIAEDWLQSMT